MVKKSQFLSTRASPNSSKSEITPSPMAIKGNKRSSAEFSSSESGHTEELDYLAGLSSAELKMIRSLAGNNPDERKKTIGKLKKWLSAVSKKAPDSPNECREILEPNFVRVWKALFYCMWMADKSLPQEQLAEQISKLLLVFHSKPSILFLFMEWFFRTIAREWPWIDKFRMDKFMMLVRRFLRRSLRAIAEHSWNEESIDRFIKILTNNIFNHHPAFTRFETRAKKKEPLPEKCPVGLQIHVIDIFLEELAKIGGGGDFLTKKGKKIEIQPLNSEQILRFLNPFIQELTLNEDERVTSEIKERIFNHLIRQSDVGIDYEEGFLEDDADDDEGEDDDEEGLKETEEDDDIEELMDDTAETEIVLDPRAGKDAILPQLDINFKELAKSLQKATELKDIRKKNKKVLVSLIKDCESICGGDYPLALPTEDELVSKRAITKKEYKRAAKRLLEHENELLQSTREFKRLSKKKRKKLAQQTSDSAIELFPEEDSSLSHFEDSAYLEDDDMMEHLTDNYLSYFEEISNKNEEEEENENRENNSELEMNNEMPCSSTNIKNNIQNQNKYADVGKSDNKNTGNKKGKKRNRKSSFGVEVEAEDNNIILNGTTDSKNEVEMDTYIILKKRPKKVETFLENDDEGEQKQRGVDGKKMKGKAQENDDLLLNDINNDDGDKTSTNLLNFDSPKTGGSSKKSKTLTSFREKNKTPGSIGSPIKKRVSFILARNSHHEHSDYAQSIVRSPALPFDSDKKPNFGLLRGSTPKSQNSTPLRARASEFFDNL